MPRQLRLKERGQTYSGKANSPIAFTKGYHLFGNILIPADLRLSTFTLVSPVFLMGLANVWSFLASTLSQLSHGTKISCNDPL